MKKPTLKRFAIGLVQHLTAAVIMVALAGILFNSYINVSSMKESKTYWMEPLDTEPEFEDSDVFHDMFSTAASDIMQYVVIQEEMENGGVFDADKRIDVTRYAARRKEEADCDVTAVYKLEDLIKWGKHGIEYSNRPMSMTEFVNYFGPAASVENFALDEDGELYFAGFRDSAFAPERGKSPAAGEDAEEGGEDARALKAEREKVLEAMEEKTVQELEDMAFSYIVSETAEEINVSREDDGSYTVYVSMINCRYSTVDGEKQLSAYSGDWIQYLKLKNNLVTAIESLEEEYELYQKGQELYGEGKSNLKYAVRMMSENGITRTYTNVPDMKMLPDSEITEYFSEYRRYFVYYLENLEFTGMTSLTEGDIYRFMQDYGYAYPEKTHIWMAVDTGYAVAGDSFYDACGVFERIVPNIAKLIVIIMILTLLWLIIGAYLTATAGVAYNDDGERVYYQNAVDRIWTEVMVLAGILIVYEGIQGVAVLKEVANNVYSSHSELLGMSSTKLYEYGTFGMFGGLVSFGAGVLWYSLVRRIRSKSLWKGSFCHWLLGCIQKGVGFVFTHKNTVVSTLLPYNLFLLCNLVAVFLVFWLRDTHRVTVVLITVGTVFLDGMVGVFLFRRNAEHVDIVEGIKRIRDGEVDYKLDSDSLSGTNREMADAVNNIGEGIRKAVQTSMKDEQMKSDLITNVSHDIKTPLTSIISYVDLLKRLKIEEEPAKSYIDILDSKAQRLKQLTDDLVEASKISSGNIVLNKEKLDLTELLNQAMGEFSEKLEERKLAVVFEECNVPAYIYADSRRMWRVIENLYNNICKYAMENTRVYMELAVENKMVSVSIKNISERQMNMRGDELTERFIRGDSSRTTEGSGLGLFIAKSLTQVQDGTFEIQLDGDLFKVNLIFPEYEEKESQEQENEN
ncbi:MAG: HAMP domain-containing histidine kinase [Lachnospiraceae bacterium]|nr:HAMP domain-containing histidine kinase [Lachnospiraceae bacterium]